jgi:hypothetical protein
MFSIRRKCSMCMHFLVINMISLTSLFEILELKVDPCTTIDDSDEETKCNDNVDGSIINAKQTSISDFL